MTRAPWSEEQCKSLNAYQRSGLHPYAADDGRALVATPDGWAVDGQIVQTWAHSFAADWGWKCVVAYFMGFLCRARTGWALSVLDRFNADPGTPDIAERYNNVKRGPAPDPWTLLSWFTDGGSDRAFAAGEDPNDYADRLAASSRGT
jgi:hypothetical protein